MVERSPGFDPSAAEPRTGGTGRPTLSLVLPIYNEEEVIPELHKQLQAFLAKLGL